VIRRLITIVLLVFSGNASAGVCPDFYRFVDFGQTGKDGVLYRGGSFIRAENFDGTALLNFARSECVDVGENNTDGHGYTIPVVSRIYYNPETTGVDLTELGVVKLVDAHTAAESNAARHRLRIDNNEVVTIRGGNFLCADYSDNDQSSCQLVSPYQGNIALVVYCDQRQCEMPVMAIDEELAVSAKWDRESTAGDLDQKTGERIAIKVEQIFNFLSPLTSINPG